MRECQVGKRSKVTSQSRNNYKTEKFYNDQDESLQELRKAPQVGRLANKHTHTHNIASFMNPIGCRA
uniref:Uncharacterized protein n=1 Tax=Nelumbo nucifera TaxID=4432 RepID=A0A822YF85_NELNU|nr:TPA_asm: hypothetical protein HUJ06_009933 [Nelumbo nucifera]